MYKPFYLLSNNISSTAFKQKMSKRYFFAYSLDRSISSSSINAHSCVKGVVVCGSVNSDCSQLCATI